MSEENTKKPLTLNRGTLGLKKPLSLNQVHSSNASSKFVRVEVRKKRTGASTGSANVMSDEAQAQKLKLLMQAKKVEEQKAQAKAEQEALREKERQEQEAIKATEQERLQKGETEYITKEPTLKCLQTNDLFTLSTSEKGNKALTYPIGMITVDELMLSGFAKGFINKKIYTYNDEVYWTMSPGRFIKSSTESAGCYVYKSGDVRCENHVDGNYSARAVINVKGDAKISGGIGTSSGPYEITVD